MYTDLMKNQSFKKKYWEENYSEPELMDGIYNAREHINYLAAFLKLEEIPVNSLVDLGFGLGELFKQAIKKFRPARALGIEPSQYAYKKLLEKDWIAHWNIELRALDIRSWCLKEKSEIFDLGICTSVFQYIPGEEVEEIFEKLASRVRYLYCSIPTDREYELQVKDFDFKDEYALIRSRDFYRSAIAKSFTVVSNKILESKFFLSYNTSSVTDDLFRYE